LCAYHILNKIPPGLIFVDNNKTDTTEKQLKTPTYKPNLKTFEQDIMDSMGIVENKKRGKTYWY